MIGLGSHRELQRRDSIPPHRATIPAYKVVDTTYRAILPNHRATSPTPILEGLDVLQRSQ
ncbi:MAG: hypothetical protein AAF171_15975 [Cyanobacteria bacterium P01_A01_bin.116]